MATLVTTITETLRYRGKLGQWSWAFHRLSGLGVLLFLVLHVIDTTWAAFYPELYAEAINEYQSPLFTLGEFALVAAVVYHAINGLRIVYFDYRPHLWHLQQRAAVAVFAVVGIILLPVFLLMVGHVVEFYDGDPDIASISDVLRSQSRFLLGFLIILGVALTASFLYSLISGEDKTQPDAYRKQPSQIDAWMWTFMRWSGVLIVPLVFGHLALMHVISGVFDITAADATIVGTGVANSSGTAVQFVGERWDHLVAGIAVWRLYDGALLALVVIHGFNGLRYVVNDYASDKVLNRALNWVILFGAVALIILGMAALLAGVEDTALNIARSKVDISAVSQNFTTPFGG
jgi:succinate dehydrogenase cytochrome b556 subunit